MYSFLFLLPERIFVSKRALIVWLAFRGFIFSLSGVVRPDRIAADIKRLHNAVEWEKEKEEWKKRAVPVGDNRIKK